MARKPLARAHAMSSSVSPMTMTRSAGKWNPARRESRWCAMRAISLRSGWSDANPPSTKYGFNPKASSLMRAPSSMLPVTSPKKDVGPRGEHVEQRPHAGHHAAAWVGNRHRAPQGVDVRLPELRVAGLDLGRGDAGLLRDHRDDVRIGPAAEAHLRSEPLDVAASEDRAERRFQPQASRAVRVDERAVDVEKHERGPHQLEPRAA